ncbi:hypothetical protein F4679DRAFT_579093 [Xylaria curta]|nr:hypothetical protein F4679DRAFT_579093 [Xylaria curta]
MRGGSVAIAVYLMFAHRAAATLDIVSLYISGGATIVEASATVILPNVPSPITGDLALWSTVQLDKDFIQGVSENAPAGLGYCTNLGSNWCNFAYALTPNVQVGKSVIAAPGARVRTHCGVRKGNVFYISVECAARPCAAAPAHSWENVSVILGTPNPKWKHTGSWNFGATGGEMTTSDGGKTWVLTTLNIPTSSALC